MKTSIYHRTFAFAYVLLVAVIFCGCENENKPIIKTESEKVFDAKLGRFDKKFRIVVIDSCEYLYTDAGNNGQTVFHKGNCKFCTERSKK